MTLNKIFYVVTERDLFLFYCPFLVVYGIHLKTNNSAYQEKKLTVVVYCA